MSYDLKEVCKDIRCDIMTCIGHLGVGHIGGCLSVVEALAVLYFKEMNIDPANPKMEGRDRFICSKGHAGPAVYATLANRGYFDKKELLTLNQGGTNLPSHCDMNRTTGIDMTTGSLGQGFSYDLHHDRRRREPGRPDLGSGHVRRGEEAGQPDRLYRLQQAADRRHRRRGQ